jgi:antitoxin ParD1/3/4
MPMYAEKLSVSLPSGLVGFIEQYRATHALKSRSQVIGEALELLRQRELEIAYREANQETDTDFDIALADGLNNETW